MVGKRRLKGRGGSRKGGNGQLERRRGTVEGNDDGSTGETIRGGSWEWKVWCRPSQSILLPRRRHDIVM